MFLGCTFLYTQGMVYFMQKMYTSVNLGVQIHHSVEMVYSKHNDNVYFIAKYFMSCHTSRRTNKTILDCVTDSMDCYDILYQAKWRCQRI